MRLYTVSSSAVTFSSACFEERQPVKNKQCNALERTKTPKEHSLRAVGQCFWSFSIRVRDESELYSRMCASRARCSFLWETNDLVRVFMSHAPHQVFADMAGFTCRLDTQIQISGPWPVAPLSRNGVRKRAGTSCDNDRLREGAQSGHILLT